MISPLDCTTGVHFSDQAINDMTKTVFDDGPYCLNDLLLRSVTLIFFSNFKNPNGELTLRERAITAKISRDPLVFNNERVLAYIFTEIIKVYNDPTELCGGKMPGEKLLYVEFRLENLSEENRKTYSYPLWGNEKTERLPPLPKAIAKGTPSKDCYIPVSGIRSRTFFFSSY